MFIILAILSFAAVLYWDVKSDFNKWKKGLPVKHKKEMLIRCLLLTPTTLFLTLANFSLINIPLAILMQGAWWWELFDGFYNKIRGFSWRFNGSEDDDEADTDELLRQLKPQEQAILKWGLITLFTTLYILL
jgi:hypothetical protein